MAVTEQRHPTDELVRLGQEAFDRTVRSRLQPEDDGKFVAIDVDSEDYEIDLDDYAAIKRLLARCPAAQVLLLRAGQKGTCRFGLHR
ncbi:hypothetical protein [Zavarzinella formosa]|uniref:hypothetical protein n=1 Tax=Zavarzinella formosa TaxID=360055 RepID=UPI000302DE1A|nr:hypothetical protein [Zavarzinella formosa]